MTDLRAKSRYEWLLLAAVPAVVAVLLFASPLLGPGICFPAHTDALRPWSDSLSAQEREEARERVNKSVTDKNFSWHPDNQVISAALRKGRLPLWNPYQTAGFPLLGQSLYGIFYPPNLPLFLGDPADWYALLPALHYFLAGLFAALLLRRLGCSLAASLLGGVLFMASANLTSRFHFYMTIYPMAWAPLMLLLVDKYHKERKPLCLAGLALTAGLVILAGWQQIAVYLIYTCLAYSLFLSAPGIYRLRLRRGSIWAGAVALAGAAAMVAGRLLDHPVLFHTSLAAGLLGAAAAFFLAGEGVWRLLKASIPVGSALVLGAGISAIQMAPVFALMPHSMRHLVPPDAMARNGSPLLAGITGFFFPTLLSDPLWSLSESPLNAAGAMLTKGRPESLNYVENTVYLGLLPLVFLAFSGLKKLRRRENRFFLFLAGLLLLMGFGFSFVIHPLWLLPGFQFGDPRRAFLVFALVGALLCAMGYDRFIGEGISKRRVHLAVLFGAAALCAAGAGIFASRPAAKFLLEAMPATFLQAPEAPELFEMALHENAGQLRSALFRFALTAGLGGLALWFLRRPNLFAHLLVLLVILADLAPLSWRLNAPQKEEGFLEVHESLGLMMPSGEEDHHRIFRYTNGDPRSGTLLPLPGNMSTHFEIEDAEGYITQPLKRYFLLANAIQPDPPIAPPGVAVWPISRPEALASPILDLLGVKYLVATHPAPLPAGFEPIYDRDGLLVYLNREAFPRAFLCRKARFFDPADPDRACAEAIKAMLAPGAELRSEAMIEAEPMDMPISEGPLPEARVIYSRPEEARVTFDGPNPGGFLVLADSYYPGWRAEVDGVATPVLPAYAALRAVKVPPGSKEVLFRFEPEETWIGAAISSVSLLLLLLILSLPIRSPRGDTVIRSPRNLHRVDPGDTEPAQSPPS